jgi:hypothetical protein
VSLGSVHLRAYQLTVKPLHFMISDRSAGARFVAEALDACGDGGRGTGDARNEVEALMGRRPECRTEAGPGDTCHHPIGFM